MAKPAAPFGDFPSFAWGLSRWLCFFGMRRPQSGSSPCGFVAGLLVAWPSDFSARQELGWLLARWKVRIAGAVTSCHLLMSSGV